MSTTFPPGENHDFIFIYPSVHVWPLYLEQPPKYTNGTGPDLITTPLFLHQTLQQIILLQIQSTPSQSVWSRKLETGNHPELSVPTCPVLREIS